MFARAFKLFGFLLMGLAPLAAAETFRPEGTWTGAIIVQPAQFEIDTRVVIRRSDDGTYTGSVAYPATQGSQEYALEGIRLVGRKLEFSSRDERGTVSLFQAEVMDNDVLEGELKEGNQLVPFTLSRAPQRGVEKATPALLELDEQATALRNRFNEDADKVRLLMILSPSCGVCRMGARLVQRYVAEQIPDSRLQIYLVWEAISPRDTREAAEEAGWVLADGRAQSFWSPSKVASTAFKDMVGVQKTTAWDVFLVFDQGRRWGEAVPRYDFFMHNLSTHEELPKDRLLNAKTLASEIDSLLKRPSPAPSPAETGAREKNRSR